MDNRRGPYSHQQYDGDITSSSESSSDSEEEYGIMLSDMSEQELEDQAQLAAEYARFEPAALLDESSNEGEGGASYEGNTGDEGFL